MNFELSKASFGLATNGFLVAITFNWLGIIVFMITEFGLAIINFELAATSFVLMPMGYLLATSFIGPAIIVFTTA